MTSFKKIILLFLFSFCINSAQAYATNNNQSVGTNKDNKFVKSGAAELLELLGNVTSNEIMQANPDNRLCAAAGYVCEYEKCCGDVQQYVEKNGRDCTQPCEEVTNYCKTCDRTNSPCKYCYLAPKCSQLCLCIEKHCKIIK